MTGKVVYGILKRLNVGYAQIIGNQTIEFDNQSTQIFEVLGIDRLSLSHTTQRAFDLITFQTVTTEQTL